MFGVSSTIAGILLLTNVVLGQYTPPSARVEPLYPRGMRISVPHEPGMTLVAFHINFNTDFEGLEAGTIARDIVKVRNGRWTLTDRMRRLKVGDIIYYWVHVVYDGLGYNLLDQQHQVTEFFTEEGDKVGTGTGDIPNTGNNGQCAPTDTKVIDPATGTRKDVCAGQLLMDDPFDALNESLWRQIEQFADSPDYEFVAYRKDQRNVNVLDGALNIIPTLTTSEFEPDFIRHGTWTLEKCTGVQGTRDCSRAAQGAYILPPVMSGNLDTRNSLVFLYGKIQIRAKLPRGDWIYPVISLESYETTSASMQPQLRVASSNGNSILRDSRGTDLSGHVLCGGAYGAAGSSQVSRRFTEKLWSDDFHDYELEWRRDRIYSRVDGIEYGSTELRTPFDRPFYLRVGVAVGGHKEFPDLPTTDGSSSKPWRNPDPKGLFAFFNATEQWAASWSNDAKNLKIDHIKVWAL